MTTKTTPQRKSFDSYLRTSGGGSNPYIPPYNVIVSRSSNDYTWEDTRSGGDLRNYRTVIRKGGNATNPYTAVRSKFTGSPQNTTARMDVFEIIHNPPNPDLVVSFWYSDTYRTWLLVGSPLDTVSNASMIKAVNQSYKAFISKATAVQQSFSAGTFLGELRQSLHMIRHPAQALRSGLGNYLDTVKKRRRRLSPRDKRRYLSETWLEYSFGWAPLINDIKNARKALENSAFAHEKTQRVNGLGTDEFFQSLGEAEGALGVKYTLERIEKIKVLTYGAVRTSPDPATRQLRNVGISLTDFVPTIWELIPYSFLVDYFTNIGDVLQAWSYRSSDIAWAGRSAKSEITSKTKPAGIVPPDPMVWKSVSPGHGSCQWLTERLDRVSLHGYDIVPSLAFEVPGMSSLKWLNLAALARQHRSLVPY